MEKSYEEMLTEIEELCKRVSKLSGIKTLSKQLKNNEIVDLVAMMPFVDNFYIQDNSLVLRKGWYEVYINLKTKKVSLRHNTKEITYIYKEMYYEFKGILLALIYGLNNFVKENKRETDKRTEDKRKFLDLIFEDADDITLAKDISNAGHWAWGNRYYLFVYKGKLYHWESYNPYSTPQGNGYITSLRFFNEVENNGCGNEDLPIIKELSSVVPVEHTPVVWATDIYQKIKLSDILKDLN